jgi:hypothetical protein
MGRFSRAVVAIGVAAVLLAACGSSSKGIDTSKTLTKADYIKASDDICSTYQHRYDGIVSAAGAGLSVAQAKDTFTQKLIPLFQAEHRELLALKPPKKDAARLKAALVEMNSGINTIIGRVGGAASIADLNAIDPRGLAAWKIDVGKYGIHGCGTVGTTTTT